jgi:hypothetical protein
VLARSEQRPPGDPGCLHARANGIEPYTYMVEVLSRLPSSTIDEDLDQLLPWNQGKTIPV